MREFAGITRAEEHRPGGRQRGGADAGRGDARRDSSRSPSSAYPGLFTSPSVPFAAGFWREAGRRIAIPRRSRPPAGSAGTSWRLARRPPVAGLTAGNDVVRGMPSVNCHPRATAVWSTWLDAFPRRPRRATIATREHDTALTRVSRGAARASPRRRRCVAP